MNPLIPPLKDALFNPQVQDTAIDAAELGIDSVIDDEIIREIPIAKTILSIVKTAQNLRERYLLVQTLAFIDAMREGSVPEEELNEHKKKLDADPKFAEKELG